MANFLNITNCFASLKPGLSITQRTVVICQIQKAIATANANAASFRGPPENPKFWGTLAKVPGEKTMFNFY